MFGHDAEHALLVAVDLVNSAAATGGEEGLPDVAALTELVRRAEVSGIGELTDRDLAEVRRLRTKLLAIFAVAEEPDRAAALVNDVVAGGGSTPWLSNHDGRQWHVHYFAPDATLAEHLAGDCGMAIAQVIADRELDRLRRCEADNCDHFLVDLSRNRSKRYCDSRRCGNRTHVAAYRERRRAAASA